MEKEAEFLFVEPSIYAENHKTQTFVIDAKESLVLLVYWFLSRFNKQIYKHDDRPDHFSIRQYFEDFRTLEIVLKNLNLR